MSELSSSGRSRGRSRGIVNPVASEESSSIGHGRGPGGGRGQHFGSSETGGSVLTAGRGVRRGMERGRVVLANTDELEDRLRNMNFDEENHQYTIAPKKLFNPSVIEDHRLVKEVDVGPEDTHGALELNAKVGKLINLQTNILFLEHRPGWSLFSYRVDFKPAIDDSRLKKFLLKQQADALGGIAKYIFDGTKLFTQVPVNDGEEVIKMAAQSKDGEDYKFRLKYLDTHDENDPVALQIYNLHFQHYQEYMEMQEVKKNYYFPQLAKVINSSKGHKFQVWPGLVASVNMFQRQVKSDDAGGDGLRYRDLPALLMDTSAKVVRQETIYDVLRTVTNEAKRNKLDIQKEIKKQLVGTTVITTYSPDYYRIDDVDFDKKPSDSFEKAGKPVTFVEYYEQRYDKKVKDKNQPMVICKPKKGSKGRQGGNQQCLLIPEFLMPTGLTDTMRADFTIMRELAAETRRSPQQRYEEYKRIHEMIVNNPKIKEMQKGWGIRFSKTGFAETKGHILNPVTIKMKKRGQDNLIPGSDKADWDRELKSGQLYKPPSDMKKWVFIGMQKNAKQCEEFATSLYDTANKQGWKMGKAKIELCDKDKDFTVKAKQFIDKQADMVVLLVPNERKDRYDKVKKLALNAGIATQFVKEKTIKKNMGAVATKVALQMACKMGGEPWTTEKAIPPNIKGTGVMFVGIDVYHDTEKKSQSVYALVASLNQEASKWYSTHEIIGETEEIPGKTVKSMLMLALGAYQSQNGSMPGNIYIYRDGVGDGDLLRVKEMELSLIKSGLESVKVEHGLEHDIKLCFAVVKKRIDHKFLAIKPNKNRENPPAGTVCDTIITKSIWYDFFLVSQLTRQGTVTPIHINILFDNIKLSALKVQRLTFALTHLYYNWPGTVKVPAPVQYAHKLAQLIGDSVHAGVEVDETMKFKLFYL